MYFVGTTQLIIARNTMMSEWLDPKSHENRRNPVLLLLIGMFAVTRINIGGKLGISELGILIAAPFVFFKNIDIFRREKISGYLFLAFLWLLGAVFADWHNGTYYLMAFKGIASPLMVLANSIVLYSLLRKNPENIRFLLLGLAISAVIAIFAFQKVTDDEYVMMGSSQDAVSGVLHYKLFWSNQVLGWLGVILVWWYVQLPKVISLLLTLAIFVAYAATGGRSASAVYLMTVILIFIGGKKLSSMQSIRKYILFIFIILALAGVAFKTAYKYAAENGILSEDEQKKYERQTSGGKGGFLAMLMSGRSEFFIAATAALDRPLIGHGSHAIDNNGYVADFLQKYGSDADRQLYYQSALESVHRIPFHTQIMTFWMWHGIFGLIFWAYVLYLIVVTLMRRMAVAPPLFGYFALVLPAIIWDIFFSPFGLRVRECAIFVMCLIVRNMTRGIRYPVEIRK